MLRRKHAGFTLIELLIVVIILGILAAAVIPLFGEQSKKARVSTLKTNLLSLRNQLSLFKAEHDGQPPGVRREATGLAVINAAGTASAAVYDATAFRTPAGTVPAFDFVVALPIGAAGPGNLIDHLADISDKNGETRGGVTPVQTLTFGPYLKEIPRNPFAPSGVQGAIRVVQPLPTAALIAATITAGWCYNPYTLSFVATGTTEMPPEEVEAGKNSLQDL